MTSSLSGSGMPSLLDFKFMASQIPELKGREFNIVSKASDDKSEVNHKIKIPLKPVDTKIRITCYPYKGGNFYGKGRFAIDNASIEKQLNCVEASKYYKSIIPNNNFDNLVLLNQNKKYYIYDNETNPILNILKYIQNKDHYKIEELNDEVKKIIIPNLRGIDKLPQFNISLWNIIKNGLYLYTNKDIEFISQFLNQLAMSIKRKKGTYDMIKNLTGDILDILDNQGEKNDNIKQKI